MVIVRGIVSDIKPQSTQSQSGEEMGNHALFTEQETKLWHRKSAQDHVAADRA